MGVADQFRELGESADVLNLRENHIQRCLLVIDEGLARCRVLWLCFNRSLHGSCHLPHPLCTFIRLHLSCSRVLNVGSDVFPRDQSEGTSGSATSHSLTFCWASRP